MKPKNTGWKGESRRHSLARKGIKTVPISSRMDAYGIQYDQYGNIMPSDGLLRDLYDKAKSKTTQSKIYRTLTGKPRTPEEQKAHLEKLKYEKEERDAKKQAKEYKQQAKDIMAKSKEEQALAKQKQKVETQMTSHKEEELEQASHFGIKPKKEEIDVDHKGRLGAFKEKIASYEKKVPKEEMNDVTEEMFESVDADSVIAISENAEKLIDYKNELLYDINMLKAERSRLQGQFRTDEDKEIKDFYADQRLVSQQMKDKENQIKMSSMDESKIQNKIATIRNEENQKLEQRKNEINAFKMRNKVTLNFIDNLSKDLTRNVQKIDKQVQRMTASGKERK